MDASLNAISPVDGRYRKTTAPLAGFFSEAAIIKYRTFVEVEYLIALAKILPPLNIIKGDTVKKLRGIVQHFSFDDAVTVKKIEATTNHDVKAIEYFVKEKLDGMGLEKIREFVHFGLTSQDINNTAFPLAMRDSWEQLMKPALLAIHHKILSDSSTWMNIPMLAHTHGQAASPTLLGKEMYVFVERLQHQVMQLNTIPFTGKFGGAVGNFNAHVVAYPEIDWPAFANNFLKKSLGLERQHPTTQIEHYDHLAAFFDGIKRINNIFIDLDRDLWMYISMNYFKQKVKAGETGSSTMPHKVNPIDFENSEGNLGIANALFEHFSSKLPVSRLQRDLTDSTVIRNIGVAFAHTLIGWTSLLKGLDKVVVNETRLKEDLENNWAVVSEAIQTILRRENYPEPYEALKSLTRGKTGITQKSMQRFIDGLKLSNKVKEELKRITPHNYTGVIDIP